MQKIIDMLRVRFRDLNQELTVYENISGSYKQLDTNELMKIINLSYLSNSYIEDEQEEVDIDSNLNLQDALRLNKKRDSDHHLPCLKINVKLNRRIVPVDANPAEKYLDKEYLQSEEKPSWRSRLF